jgi:hypothetical protein
MGQLQERWDAIGYTEAAEIAQNILGSDDPTAAYQAEIAGKTAEQILAIEISLYAYHPEGNAANINTWRTATFEDFSSFRATNANMTAIAGPAATRPEPPATPEALSVEGNTISIATADGHTVEIEYRFNEDAFRESEYGFRIKVDGELVNGDRLGVGANATIATQALAENRDAIVAAMTPILQERFQMTDSGDVDVINKADLENVFDGIRSSLGNVDGTLLEVVDALTVQAVRDAVNGLDPLVIAADTKADFLSGNEFTSALSVAEEVLAQDKVNITPIVTPEPEVVLAKTRYDFITKFDSEDAAEAHDPNAMSQADLNTEWAKFHNDGFDRALSETELEAIALANVMYRRNADNTGWEWDPDAAELTLEQAQAHPDYIAVMEAHTAFTSAPSITIAAGTAPAALSITATNIADAAALTTYLEANGAALDQQVRDILYGTADDDGITMDEASAVMDKINAQLETVEAGSLEETVLKRAAEAINQDWDQAYIAANGAEESADIETAAGGDPRIETETGGNPAIREIQLYAAMAKLGNFAPLQAIEISEIDGLSGRKTGNSMINMLDMTGTELRALAGPQAAADLLDQKMRENADFRGNVLAGLRDAVSTDPEDVREFLQMQGVIEADVALTAEELTAKIAEYETSLGGAEATADANVSIRVPADETIAFDVTIAGISTPEELTAYLAEHGERIDTEIRTALYSDITAINVDDGLSAEELTMLNGWIDAQMEGASDIEKVLLERARGIIEADTNPEANAEITVTANPALIDDDRVLDGNILEDAQAVIARAGGDVPDAGILAIIEGGPMLVRQIDGETVVTQIHEDNFASVLGEGVELDSNLEGKLRERADMGDTEVKYRGVTIGVNPATADLRETSTISITKDRKDGLVNTFVSESTGKGVIIESEELADAIDHFDGRAPRDERFVTNYNLPGEFDSAAIARGLDALERAIDNNGAGSLSVEFVEGANGTTAEINYGDGQKLEIPKGLYDAIMERAGQEATRDHSQVVEISAPNAGMGG